MNKIRILSDNLANQIAAGEVVDRPASVIKELIENSIDAGATRISIEIELGGRRLMKLSDNGEGMTRDDAILAFERHATSKIRNLEDLGRIATLGFRGEALASIASVAKVELTTKIEEDLAATLVQIDGGRLIDVKDAARATGTTIAVRDLFFNTPARRKFMRSEATENYHITSIVQHYTLAHPAIAFTLTNNGREVLQVSPAKDLRERAFQVFGAGLLESLLPVTGGREYTANVSGYVSAPRERRTNRDSQYFFVNNRFVRDKTIAGGLLEGFRSVLPHGVYPVAFLFVDVPLEEVDVNVHPAKTEVRFRRSEAVKDAIAEAIRNALASAGIVAQAEAYSEANDERSVSAVAVGSVEQFSNVDQAKMYFGFDPDGPIAEWPERPDQTMGRSHEQATPGLAPPTDLPDLLDSDDLSFAYEGTQNAPEDNVNEEAPESSGRLLAETKIEGLGSFPPINSAEKFTRTADVQNISGHTVRPIAQLHDSFIIAVDDEGLLLIDQHVAHERILFDKYKARETGRTIESQNLLLPETLDLSPAQSEAFQLVEDQLAEVGFDVMKLSGRTIAIKSIPTDLPAAEAKNLLAEILDNIDLEKRGAGKSTLRDDIAASLACKAAVKINMRLTQEKMQWLMDRLLLTSSPTTCPHGRPVILRLTMKDIERGFHRT
ncbi:MAG: DNA mismatch repair endonuclease MutL [Acidobacteria bacterium]|nr:MAG: DNA mismatch repair endonuclease MutL [Acidobacteriota bacterium]